MAVIKASALPDVLVSILYHFALVGILPACNYMIQTFKDVSILQSKNSPVRETRKKLTALLNNIINVSVSEFLKNCHSIDHIIEKEYIYKNSKMKFEIFNN